MPKCCSNNNFFTRVHDLVALIPEGKVMTYGQIARALESSLSAKFVGFAMAAAPVSRSLPCHRVVNRLGQMSPGSIFGGEDHQRALLINEGVPFFENGRVNLEKALWEPC